MIMFGCAMSIFARSTCAPSGNSPAFIRRSRSRFSSTERSRYGLFVPGVVTVPRLLADLLLVLRIDVRLALLHQQLGELVQLLEVVARVELRVPLEAEPAHVVLDRLDVLACLRWPGSCRRSAGCSGRRTRRAMPKFRQIDFAWPMCRKPFGSGGNRVAGGRPKRPVATSSATMSRMKSRFGGAAVTTRTGAGARG